MKKYIFWQKLFLKLALILSAVGCGKPLKINASKKKKARPHANRTNELLSKLHYSWHKLDTYQANEDYKGIAYSQSSVYQNEANLEPNSDLREKTTYYFDQSDVLIKTESVVYQVKDNTPQKKKVSEFSNNNENESLDVNQSALSINEIYRKCENDILRHGDDTEVQFNLKLNTYKLLKSCSFIKKLTKSKAGLEEIKMFIWQ